MAFQNLDSLFRCFRDLGVERILCKPLAENDNSKQQVYLGGSFAALNLLPFGEVRADPGSTNFKAPLDLSWVDSDGRVAPATHSQLILYPQYPEVRLSGFLRGCPLAPNQYMRPVPAAERRFDNGHDGRLLLLGMRADRSILAYLATPQSAVAMEILKRRDADEYPQTGVFFQLQLQTELEPRADLINRLRSIHHAGWHRGERLDRTGRRIPYTAQNGGGYTLEAQFGIIPNGRSAPDFRGWELKAFSGSRVTLMTPEPDAGYYGTNGVEAFVRKYGHATGPGTVYFTGVHRVDMQCEGSRQTLTLRGFDAGNGKITDVTGGIDLIDANGDVSASWSFGGLITHWGLKHASAAYVPYTKAIDNGDPAYRYESPVLLGEGTDFSLCLSALHSGLVVYDPGSKLTGIGGDTTRVKARSQFRVNVRGLSSLYRDFSEVPL